LAGAESAGASVFFSSAFFVDFLPFFTFFSGFDSVLAAPERHRFYSIDFHVCGEAYVRAA
jgi:hypothetical protein